MLLDDQFDEPLKSDGESWNRINGSYDNPVVDDVPFGSGLLVVGQAGDLWRFNHDSVALNCRPQWSRVVILPPTEKMSAVAADVSTRRIWLAGNGRIYETELSAASEMKLTEVVAERTFPKVERLAALSGDTLMFSAEKETGALERNKEGRYRLLWTVSFPKKVVDIAAMEKAVIVAMEDSLAVLAPTTGQCVFVLTETSVAGGFEISRIAMDSKWLVVGDTKNYRIVRFKIKD